jgi:microcystin-dependent protein
MRKPPHEPLIGEIRMFAGDYAPDGWALCDGRLLSVDDNDTLYQLIGNSYGGVPAISFKLPDLRGRVPVHKGPRYVMCSKGGVEQVDLTIEELPHHNHEFRATTSGGASATPHGNVVASPPSLTMFLTDAPSTSLVLVRPAGGSEPHENRMPFVAINYIISLYGTFPTGAES